MSSHGWIRLHRQIQDSNDWLTEPFTRAQAWVDILLTAAHKPHAVRIRGILIPLNRGQMALSEREYAKRWKWSRGKVRRFVAELASETVQRIVPQINNVTTVVTVLNYETYQSNGTTNGTTSDTTDGPQTDRKRATDGPIQEGKEGKNVENVDKNTPPTPQGGKRKKFTKPTLNHVTAYVAEIKAGIDPQQFMDHYTSNGWKVGKNSMKDWKAAVGTWKRNGINRKRQGNGQGKAAERRAEKASREFPEDIKPRML